MYCTCATCAKTLRFCAYDKAVVGKKVVHHASVEGRTTIPTSSTRSFVVLSSHLLMSEHQTLRIVCNNNTIGDKYR